jgi:hypothetical protein
LAKEIPLTYLHLSNCFLLVFCLFNIKIVDSGSFSDAYMAAVLDCIESGTLAPVYLYVPVGAFIFTPPNIINNYLKEKLGNLCTNVFLKC